MTNISLIDFKIRFVVIIVLFIILMSNTSCQNIVPIYGSDNNTPKKEKFNIKINFKQQQPLTKWLTICFRSVAQKCPVTGIGRLTDLKRGFCGIKKPREIARKWIHITRIYCVAKKHPRIYLRFNKRLAGNNSFLRTKFVWFY